MSSLIWFKFDGTVTSFCNIIPNVKCTLTVHLITIVHYGKWVFISAFGVNGRRYFYDKYCNQSTTI